MSNESYCVYCMNTIPGEAAVCPWCQKNPADYHAELHHLPPNSILYGKYLIGRVLGEGGFGITYLARDLNLDIRVAVKEYYPYGCVNRNHTWSEDITVSGNVSKEEFETGKRKLMGEARTLAIFSDLKGIVGVRDFFLFNNTAYIVMDYLDGITLKESLKTRGTMPFDEVVNLLTPVMEDLIRVHETGLIHRDISPDNIMILKDGTARLMDFGAARQSEGTDSKSLSIVLKPGYTPEEQYRSRGEQGPWTDVYALCATIYKAITGVLPEEALQRLVEDTLKTPSRLGIKLPPEKEQALMKGLAVSRKDRYQNMAELAKALKNGEKTGQRQKEIPRETGGTSPRKRAFLQKGNWKLAAGIAAAVVLCVVLAFTSFREKETGDSLEDFAITIDGVYCKFPMACPEFVKLWWGTWDLNNDDWIVESGNMEVIDVADDVDAANFALVYNPDNRAQMIGDCYVYTLGMGDDLANGHEILLPKGLMFGQSTMADIDSAFGVPTMVDICDTETSQIYKLDNGSWQFTVDNDTGTLCYVTLDYKCGLYPEGYEPTAITVSEGEMEEEKNYTAPENLGDDLMSDIVEYDGDLYRLPCPVSAMMQNGWQIADNMEREYLAPEKGVPLDLVRDGKRINLFVSNPDTQARYLENCFINAMGTEEGTLVLPGGISPGMTESDFYRVVKTSGYIYETSEDENTVYIYRDWNASTYDRAEVYINDERIIASVSYRLSGFTTGDNTRSSQEDASVQIGDSLEDFEIMIDGERYQFPVSWQELVEKGWEMEDQEEETEEVWDDGLNSAIMRLGETEAVITFYNPDNKPQMLRDCYMYVLDIGSDLAGDHEILLPKGLMFGYSTMGDIVSAFGEDMATVEELDTYTIMDYELENGSWKFVFDNKTGTLYQMGLGYKLSLYPEGYEPGAITVSAGETEEEKQYTAPENLGDDLMSGIVEYGGDLYSLPCPVSAMLQNGWKIAANMEREYLAPMGGMTLDLVRDGKRKSLSVKNIDTQQARYLENCFVWRMEETDGTLVLPGGIRPRMTESDFYKVVEQSGCFCKRSESGKYVYIYQNEESYNSNAEIHINGEGIVSSVEYNKS